MARTPVAADGVFRADAKKPDRLAVLRRVCRARRRFALPGQPSGWNVRNYENAGGLLRYFRQRALQRREPTNQARPQFLLLPVPRFLLLDHAASTVGPGDSLRRTRSVGSWRAECCSR